SIMSQHVPRGRTRPAAGLLGVERVELVGEHLDAGRGDRADVAKGSQEAGEVELAGTREHAVVERCRGQIRLGGGGPVVELDPQNRLAGYSAQRSRVATAAEVVPRVDEQPA